MSYEDPANLDEDMLRANLHYENIRFLYENPSSLTPMERLEEEFFETLLSHFGLGKFGEAYRI